MNKNRFLSVVIVVLMPLLFAGCSKPQAMPDESTPTPTTSPFQSTPTPTIVVSHLVRINTHPKPDFSLDVDKFKEAGCLFTDGEGSCEDESLVALLGCDYLYPDELLGALTPSYPIMICYADDPPTELVRYYKEVGCALPLYLSYVVLKDNAFQLVSDASEFRMLFAPITSADEALSYALKATDLHANYDTELDPYVEYLTEGIENTFVKETLNGYVVHLFTPASPSCGCGKHKVSTVDVLITKEGKLEKGNPQPAYQVDACFD